MGSFFRALLEGIIFLLLITPSQSLGLAEKQELLGLIQSGERITPPQLVGNFKRKVGAKQERKPQKNFDYVPRQSMPSDEMDVTHCALPLNVSDLFPWNTSHTRPPGESLRLHLFLKMIVADGKKLFLKGFGMLAGANISASKVHLHQHSAFEAWTPILTLRYVRTELVFPLQVGTKDMRYPYDVFGVFGTSLLPDRMPRLGPPLPDVVTKIPGVLLPLDEMYRLRAKKKLVNSAMYEVLVSGSLQSCLLHQSSISFLRMPSGWTPLVSSPGSNTNPSSTTNPGSTTNPSYSMSSRRLTTQAMRDGSRRLKAMVPASSYKRLTAMGPVGGSSRVSAMGLGDGSRRLKAMVLASSYKRLTAMGLGNGSRRVAATGLGDGSPPEEHGPAPEEHGPAPGQIQPREVVDPGPTNEPREAGELELPKERTRQRALSAAAQRLGEGGDQPVLAFNAGGRSMAHLQEATQKLGAEGEQAVLALNAGGRSMAQQQEVVYPRDIRMLISPFYGISVDAFITLLLHHMRWHAAFGINKYVVYVVNALTPVKELRGNLRISALLTTKRLLIVQWVEMPEHDSLIRGRPYLDQVLIYNHAMLAYWAMDVQLVVADIDEYLMSPIPKPAVDLLQSCSGSNVIGQPQERTHPAAQLKVCRYTAVCTSCQMFGHSKELSVWLNFNRATHTSHPSDLPNVLQLPDYTPHPLLLYSVNGSVKDEDMYQTNCPLMSKSIIFPTQMDTYRVHYGYAPYALTSISSGACAKWLHVEGLFRSRRRKGVITDVMGVEHQPEWWWPLKNSNHSR